MQEDRPLTIMRGLSIAMITHYQSSGSVYLHSLFDGHPQILTIPGIPQLDPIIQDTFESPLKALNMFNHVNPKFFNTLRMTPCDQNSVGLYRLGKKANEGIETDKKIFNAHYFECMRREAVTPQNIILSLYYAYGKAHGLDFNKISVILFHPHAVRRTIYMNNIFPNSKFLVTIRDSSRAYNSRLNLMKNKARLRNIKDSHLGLLIADANNVYEFLKHNMSMKIIRIEDFELYHRHIMTKLCKYLNIEYCSSLEKSTFGLKEYWGANTKYKSNTFLVSRHKKPLSLKRHELVLFGIINKDLNQITGYSSVKLTRIENKFWYLWLLLPFQEDFNWFKREFIYNESKGAVDYSGRRQSKLIIMLKLIYERLKLIRVVIRNSNENDNYLKIKKCLINSEY